MARLRMLTIGIDFGTTNCSAAIYRDGQPELIPLEDGGPILPSMICIDQDQRVLLGRRAIESFLCQTRGMPIRYKFTDLRSLTSVFRSEVEENPLTESENGLVVVSDAGEDEDLDTPARLFQSLKTGLRDPDFHGTTVFGRYYAIEELIALILGHIRLCAQDYTGQAVQAAVIGRPISYASAEHPLCVTAEEIDQTAHERMLAAARLAGFTHAALEFEPVAATRHFRPSLLPNTYALIFDFGGGTLDLALSYVFKDGSLEIVATHGVLVGGDDLDSAIMRHALLKHFGLGTTLGSKELPFPPNLLAPLLHWQSMPLLAKPAQLAHIAAIKRQSNAPHTVENLQTLISEGLGFELFQCIEAAKIALSDAPEMRIRFQSRGLNIDERLTRGMFVSAIADHLASIEMGLSAVLEKAKCQPADVSTVVMTGGSSQVPVLQSIVRRFFAAATVRVAEPFTSIAAGLGIIAAQDDLCSPVGNMVAEATAERLRAEAVTIGETVAFDRGHQTVQGVVVGRAGGRVHDAILVIEFWDSEIEQFVSTMRHETKVRRLRGRHGIAPQEGSSGT
jgi:hypothetical chaperone protein